MLAVLGRAALAAEMRTSIAKCEGDGSAMVEDADERPQLADYRLMRLAEAEQTPTCRETDVRLREVQRP